MSPLEILGLSIKRLQHSSHCTLNARLAPLGLSLVQWNALREIKRHPGLSMHRLAECTFNSDQAFGTLMARLRRQKLVEQQPGAGRTNLHRLTERGETLLAAGTRCLRRNLAKIFAPLSADEHAQFQTLLDKVLGDNPYLPSCPVAASDPVDAPAGGPHAKTAPPRARSGRSGGSDRKSGAARQAKA